MRGFLLDTNALLWMLADDPRLGARTRNRLVTASDVRFSSVNILELTIKSMLGRLEAREGWAAAATSLGLVELPFTAEHAEAIAVQAELVRHDPFDRMLFAQAHVQGLALVTADRALLELGHGLLVDARR